MSIRDCTEITPACPVVATTYGYVPNLGANVLLLVLFALCAIIQTGLGVWFRSWTFMVALVVGCLMEVFGYVGRVMMHNNVWNENGFRIQIVCLILAPSFVAAGIYLSLKHMVIYLGSESSRLPARWYTWLFIGFDILSILIQAAGGGIAGAAGKENPDLLDLGNNLMIAGIAIQVITMTTCGFLAVDFFLRYRRQSKQQTANAAHMPGRWKAYTFFEGVVLAYVTILIRCIYRLPEMAGGWGNPLMRNEKEFLILDGMMVALAAVALTILHPGFWFPSMTGRSQERSKSSENHELELIPST